MLRAPQSSPSGGAVATVKAWIERLRFRRPSKRLLALAGAATGIVLAALAAVGPMVRAKVASESAKRKLDVDVGGVRPGFFAVTLRDVHVKPHGIPEIEAHLDEVRVELSASLAVKEIAVRGGAIAVSGEPNEVLEKLAAYRASTKGTETASKGARTPIALSDIGFAWKLPSGDELRGSGLRASRVDTTTTFGCASCSGAYKHFRVSVTDGDVTLGPDNGPQKVSARAVDLAYEPPKPVEVPKVAAPATQEVPALPAAAALGAKKGAKLSPLPIAPEGPLLPLPDLHALRSKLQLVATTLGDRLHDGATVDIQGLSAKLDIGGDPASFGPGAFSLARRGEVVHVSFASERADNGKSTPLSLDADLPLRAHDVTARLSGGPVSLGALVKEGTKGLFDVAKATVSGKGQLTLAAKGDALVFDGRVELRDVSFKNVRLAPGPVRGMNFATAARGALDDQGRLRIDDAQLDMGALHIRAHGNVEETKDHFALALGLDVAPAACQALVDSAPQGLFPLVQSMRMTGTFGATGRVGFDTRAIDKLALDYQIDDRCRVSDVPRELATDRFSGSFTYPTYHPDGTPSETTTGPGTASWTSLDDISPFMIAAVTTTEDGAFYKHHGFNHAAIRSSVQANLKARRFVRGASTITMQLAKNLFLSREKTMSRKIEEVVLTDYLEQVFRKDDLMELYLNVIEFGPDVYGITNAAEHYFGRRPAELSAPECFFLATLLPAPARFGRGLKDKGEVPEGWMRTIRSLMEIAGKHNKLSPSELSDAQTQEIRILRTGDARPEPRKVKSNGRRDPYGDDGAGWQPVD